MSASSDPNDDMYTLAMMQQLALTSKAGFNPFTIPLSSPDQLAAAAKQAEFTATASPPASPGVTRSLSHSRSTDALGAPSSVAQPRSANEIKMGFAELMRAKKEADSQRAAAAAAAVSGATKPLKLPNKKPHVNSASLPAAIPAVPKSPSPPVSVQIPPPAASAAAAAPQQTYVKPYDNIPPPPPPAEDDSIPPPPPSTTPPVSPPIANGPVFTFAESTRHPLLDVPAPVTLANGKVAHSLLSPSQELAAAANATNLALIEKEQPAAKKKKKSRSNAQECALQQAEKILAEFFGEFGSSSRKSKSSSLSSTGSSKKSSFSASSTMEVEALDNYVPLTRQRELTNAGMLSQKEKRAKDHSSKAEVTSVLKQLSGEGRARKESRVTRLTIALPPPSARPSVAPAGSNMLTTPLQVVEDDEDEDMYEEGEDIEMVLWDPEDPMYVAPAANHPQFHQHRSSHQGSLKLGQGSEATPLALLDDDDEFEELQITKKATLVTPGMGPSHSPAGDTPSPPSASPPPNSATAASLNPAQTSHLVAQAQLAARRAAEHAPVAVKSPNSTSSTLSLPGATPSSPTHGPLSAPSLRAISPAPVPAPSGLPGGMSAKAYALMHGKSLRQERPLELAAMLRTNIGYRFLLIQCYREYSEENVLAFKAIDMFRKHATLPAFHSIMSKYVASGSGMMLNISSTVRKDLETFAAEVTQHTKNNTPLPDSIDLTAVFDPAQKEILTLLERDSFKRFKQSLLYVAYVSGAQPPTILKRGGEIDETDDLTCIAGTVGGTFSEAARLLLTKKDDKKGGKK